MISFLFNKLYTLIPSFNNGVFNVCNLSFVSFVGVNFISFNSLDSVSMSFNFCKNLLCLSSSINPTLYPYSLNLISELSSLRIIYILRGMLTFYMVLLYP